MERLVPKDHREEVAVFRHGLIGELVSRSLDHGERMAQLRRLSGERVRPPGADSTRCYSIPTLERWLYAFKRGGLAALAPHPRADQGRGRDLDPALRELLCDIRREHPSVSVTMIVRTLQHEGRASSELKECTVRRMLAAASLPRLAPADRPGPRTRLRWQAERPNALWHGDVCHGPTLVFGEQRVPIRIHALLDDASRYVVALRVADNEREETMLSLFSDALTMHGRPDALYLDNGSTYRGAVLATACARLGVSLLHARPYDPEARGKMERFWRTLRGQALDHLGHVTSLAEVDQKLHAWLSRYYQTGPHAGVFGRAPAAVFAEGDAKVRVEPDVLREALMVRTQRRVHKDATLSVDGALYEVAHGYLAGQMVTVATSLFDGAEPFVEADGRRVSLSLVNPVANSRRRRAPRHPGGDRAARTVDFDPSCTLAPLAPAAAALPATIEIDNDDIFLPDRLRPPLRTFLQGD